MRRFLVVVFLCFCLSGCYDYQELNEMAIVNGIGIDYDDGKYVVTAEIIKTSRGKEENTIESKVVVQKDENIAQAFKKIDNSIDKHLYLKHLSLLVLGTSLENVGVVEVIDYIIRDVDINNNYHVVVADDAEELLSLKKDDSISTIIGNNINIITGNDKKNSVDSIANSLVRGRVLVVPFVDVMDEEIEIDNIAYFRGDKYLGKVSNRVYNFLINKSSDVLFSDGEMSVSISKKKVKFKVKRDKIVIDVKGDALVKSVGSSLDLEDSSSYSDIHSLMSEKIKEEIEKFVDELYVDNGVDILDFRNRYYDWYKKDVDRIDYEVNVDIVVNKNGASLGSVFDE